MMAQAIANLGCERAGEAMRRLSNSILTSVDFASGQDPVQPRPGDRISRRDMEERRKWQRHFRSPSFWHKVWERLADVYRGCDLDCFDDGVAVGQISGAGYCAASVGVGGLSSPGFAYQPPMPLCQNAIFTGCQRGYRDAASTYQGCAPYSSGDFDAIFRAYLSQDCHIDAGF
jgi:hypothetical protein